MNRRFLVFSSLPSSRLVIFSTLNVALVRSAGNTEEVPPDRREGEEEGSSGSTADWEMGLLALEMSG